MRHATGAAVHRLVLRADTLDAPAAHAIGLVDKLHPAERLLEAALCEARSMSEMPAEVYATTKRRPRQPARERIVAHSADHQTITETWASPETRGTITRYLNFLNGN